MQISEQSTKKFFLAGGIILYLAFFLFYVNDSYPWVGHDYRYFLPRMLDTHIHYLYDGFSIQWFTPSFGGGLPAFPNPQQIQFSLTQLLVFLFDPWQANLFSAAIYTLVGYFACYRLGREILNLGWMASVLGALFFVTNGFYVQHIAAGHVNFLAFPLSPLFFYVLFNQKWREWHRGILLGIILAIFIHSAGFYLVVVLILSFMMVVPIVYLLQPNQLDLKRLAKVVGMSILVGILLTIGKMYAVLGFMQHFPRVITDIYYTNLFEALTGLVVQLTGVPLFTIPLQWLKDDPSAIGQMMTALIGGKNFGLWEMDVSISPVLIFILFYQFRKLLKGIKEWALVRQLNLVLKKDQMIAVVTLVVGVWLAFEFTSARGLLYDQIRNLPVLSSLYNNLRYAASFILPLFFFGGYYFDRELSNIGVSRRTKVFAFFFGGTLLWFGVYFLLPHDLQSRGFNVEQVQIDYRNLTAGEEFYVYEVKEIIDYRVFSNHATSLIPHEPIFGYAMEEFSTSLVPGSVYLEQDGRYNLVNPRSLVYKTDALFERFELSEREKMEMFVHYQQPDWEIPRIQHILNTISLGTLLLIFGYGGYWLIKIFRGSRRKSI